MSDEPTPPPITRFPNDAVVRTQAEWRDLIWKWLGFPEELWALAELLGLIIHRHRGSVLSAPARDEFVIVLPRPSRPQDSVLYALSEGCQNMSVDQWRAVLQSMLDYGRDNP